MSVPVTPEEMKSPLYKYYLRDIKPTPPELVEKVMKEEFAPDGGMPPSEMNRLFDDGYLPGEFGVWGLPSGGHMMANLTQMPGVTPEMFDWWFAWHGLNSMRYKIWNKDEHHYVKTRNPEIALDSSLTMKQRYWNTTHDVHESMLPDQEPMHIPIAFVPPETVGFDPVRLGSFKGTIVCTPRATMVHFLRPTEDGCELRTRFWMVPPPGGMPPRGPAAEGGQRPGMPGMGDGPADKLIGGKVLLIHNIKEFTHLAEILPEVYAEFKDDFRVEPFDF